MKHISLFVGVQLASLVLTIAGVPICGTLALLHLWHQSPIKDGGYHWPKWAWLWDNAEDGLFPSWYMQQHPTWGLPRIAFVWTALRNPCNNLRYVRGVSAKGRPLWRKTWGDKPGGWYAQAGWNTAGFPVLSAGRNINPW